jgi:hypothetical protein
MPIVYNGSSAGITANQPVSVTNPVDGDALTAASNNTAAQTLANFLQFLQERALLTNFNNAATVVNAMGGRFTGNGTGAGVMGTGGATNGVGGDFYGSGSGTAHGVRGTGSGTGAGVFGTAAGGGGTAGVQGVANSGPGNTGVSGMADGATGVGVFGRSDLYRGVEGLANGVGADGVYGRIGAIGATGAGVVGDGNGQTGAAGGRFLNGTGRANRAVDITTGHLRLSSGNAANTEGFSNSLVANNIVKAYGVIQWNAGAPAIVAARCFNVSSCSSPAAGQIDITLAQALTGYAVVVGTLGGGPWVMRVVFDSGASPYRVLIQDGGGATVNFNTTTGELRFIIIGTQ